MNDMREIKDLKSVQDIPNIEKYVDLEFYLQCYERGDNLQCWAYDLEDGIGYRIDLHSNEQLITGKSTFWEIITQEGLDYLCFNIWKDENIQLDSWDYRPLVPDEEKTFI